MNEKELIEYVEKLNNEIEFNNIGKPKHQQQELYDLDKVLKGFYKIQRKDEIKEFRDKYDCNDCLYFEKPKRCKAVDSCPIENVEGFKVKKENTKKCILDKVGNCPYGKYVESCMGYCMKNLVKEHREQWSFRYGEKS